MKTLYTGAFLTALVPVFSGSPAYAGSSSELQLAQQSQGTQQTQQMQSQAAQNLGTQPVVVADERLSIRGGSYYEDGMDNIQDSGGGD